MTLRSAEQAFRDQPATLSRRSTILPLCSTAAGIGYATRIVTKTGSFCLRGGVTRIAGEHPGRHADYYLKVAIRGLVGRSITIPAFNDSAPNFASIADVISRARELAAAVADGTRA